MTLAEQIWDYIVEEIIDIPNDSYLTCREDYSIPINAIQKLIDGHQKSIECRICGAKQ